MAASTESCILVVDRDPHLREVVQNALSGTPRRVLAAESGSEALAILGRERVGLVFSELGTDSTDGQQLLRQMHSRHPHVPAVVMTAEGSIEHAVDVMRGGAADYLVKPFDPSRLATVVEKYFAPGQHAADPVSVDPASRALFDTARRVAATEVTVTIAGESGTGKEVLARFIHSNSPRRHGPFVAINCAAIPDNMLEAVLFGHEKGAFTGATRAHAGKFEQANRGTLLLDEISEMDLALQAKLLRVLQEREVERIGGQAPAPLDVRVLTTTNRTLRDWVTAGRFREDLYYRLNVLPLRVPALRERRGDIAPLAELFVARQDRGRQLAPCARDRLQQYDWPGNVRELDNLVQRSAILSTGPLLRAADLVFETGSSAPVPADDSGLHERLTMHEFDCIRHALLGNGGKRLATAKDLGISPRTLRYKLARMREVGIDVPGDTHE